MSLCACDPIRHDLDCRVEDRLVAATSPRDLVDAEALTTAYDVSESTIRTWAHRGYLTPYPQGHRRRTLYSLSEFAQVFTERSTKRMREGKHS